MKAIIALVAVGIVITLAIWNEQRMRIQEQAYMDYEECVQTRAGVSVSTYYQKYGYAPECY